MKCPNYPSVILPITCNDFVLPIDFVTLTNAVNFFNELNCTDVVNLVKKNEKLK
jgi:hypothetical protein